MSIQQFVEEIKKTLSGDLYVMLVIIFIGLSSFGLGRLSALEEQREPVRIVKPSNSSVESLSQQAAGAGTVPESATGSFVASKNSDKYHLPWCSGAERIKESNKIWFGSKEEAETAGYTPAANCEGL